MRKQQQEGHTVDGPADLEENDPTIVSAADRSAGGIGYDELGQPRWTWVTEAGSTSGLANEDTFDYLKALDNDSLALEEPDDAPGRVPKESGYDPYDTAQLDVRSFRNRLNRRS